MARLVYNLDNTCINQAEITIAFLLLHVYDAKIYSVSFHLSHLMKMYYTIIIVI